MQVQRKLESTTRPRQSGRRYRCGALLLSESEYFSLAASVPDDGLGRYPDKKPMFDDPGDLVQFFPKTFGVRDILQMTIQKVVAAVCHERLFQAAANIDLGVS